MTQEQANKIFATELGQQLNVIWVTPDDVSFIRFEEAIQHCLHLGLDKDKIADWYPEYE